MSNYYTQTGAAGSGGIPFSSWSGASGAADDAGSGDQNNGEQQPLAPMTVSPPISTVSQPPTVMSPVSPVSPFSTSSSLSVSSATPPPLLQDFQPIATSVPLSLPNPPTVSLTSSPVPTPAPTSMSFPPVTAPPSISEPVVTHAPVVDPNATPLTASDFAPPAKKELMTSALDVRQPAIQSSPDANGTNEKDGENAWYTTPLGVAGIIGMAAVVGVVGYSLAQNGTLLPGNATTGGVLPGAATFGAADGQSLFSKSALGAGVAASNLIGSSNILKDLELL